MGWAEPFATTDAEMRRDLILETLSATLKSNLQKAVTAASKNRMERITFIKRMELMQTSLKKTRPAGTVNNTIDKANELNCVDDETFDFVSSIADNLHDIRYVYVLGLPSDQMLFNMMRACVGITDIKDLWFYEERQTRIAI